MKKIATSIIALALCVVVAAPAMSANAVRLSMVYGGGGSSSSSAMYTTDFVELFNSSGVAVNIGGWVIEYGSATGNWGSSTGNYYTLPAGAVIQPCSYVLVAVGTPGSGGAALPVTPDFTGTGPNMSATSGKVALFSALNANTPCGSEIAGTLVDKLAWGSSATCAEVANATYAGGNLDATLGCVRNGGGMIDTDNNSLDFTVQTGLVPRNSASPANATCLAATPAPSSSWGKIKTMYR